MKKVIPGVLVLVAVALAAAFIFLKKAGGGHHVAAPALVPAETIFFMHLPDLKRTAERWPKTGLAQIAAEPEVQAFLAKPRANAPQFKFLGDKLDQLARIDAGEGFLAVASLEGATPRFLAGISYSGRKSELEALLNEPRTDFKKSWPAGKSDLTTQGRTEIQTFSYQDTTVGEAFVEDWYFVSNDMELLRKTIDIAAQGLADKALAANDLYQKTMAHLPADGEGILFAQMGVLSERLVSLLVASGQTPDPKQIEDLKKIQAVAWGTKFEGAQMRDTLFLLSPGNATEPAMARSALALSSPSTFLTYATALPTLLEVPESSMALGAFLPGLASIEKGLEDKGLKWSDFGKAFGPEFGVVANWGESAAQPSILLALDVRDSALARGFVDVFTGGLPGSAAWARKDENGVTLYQSPAASGLIPLTPMAALTEKFLVIGFSQPEILAGLEQLKSGKAVIAGTPAYDNSVKTVNPPTAGFGYLDLKTLFERAYGTLRPFIAMSLAFSPEAGKYIDAGKLPSAEVISKHLVPSVYSQSATPDGTLVESVGTLTFNQILLGSVGSAVAAAFPMIESALAGGLNLDPSNFQLPTPANPGDSSEKPAKNDENGPEPALPAPKPEAAPAPLPLTPQL